MKNCLNLANRDKSDIKYKISKFPDGQQSITIDVSTVTAQGFTPVNIMSHLNSFEDLELIIVANKALREIDGVYLVRLYTPYFLGARSDRKFVEGSVNYIKEVIAPIINAQNFDRVIVIDPHSDVLEGCINRFQKLDNVELVQFALNYTYGDDWFDKLGRIAFVSPDGGSLKKVYHVVESLKYAAHEVIIASKHRDLVSGKIVSTNVTILPDHLGLDLMILDDICDGGRTFNELAKALRAAGATGRIFLVVTHGIFSAGFKELNANFDGIFCTNSVVDMNDNMFSISNDNQLHKLHQLNVF